ncbi:hypothetical protein [uncultured Variovorax sp.]|nr:hypothetical protein [uncultured Variovorax sp.]
MTKAERFVLTLTLLASGMALMLNGQFFAGLPLQACAAWLMTDWGRAKP